jgi:hypothetical protein
MLAAKIGRARMMRAVGLALCLTLAFVPCVSAKKWTVTEREVALEQKIAKAEKASQLTSREAEKLRKKLAAIRFKQAKMKAGNDGKLSYEDNERLEKLLNSLSLEIQKFQLEKRIDE